MASIGGGSDLDIKINATGGEKVKAEIGVALEELKKVKAATEDAASSNERMAGSMEMIKKIAEAWGLFEIAKEIASAFGEANAEANRLVTSLIAVTGSLTAAKAAYEEIHEVVRTTGVQAEEATQAWMRMANVGIKPNAELIKSLQGVAVETGRDITTVANAFAMSAEGHARGLSQIGVAVQDVGDKVLVSFQGQSQLIDKTKEGIQEYILSIGQAPAAIEAMNAKLNTSAGAWDQLKKAAGDLFETLGGGGSGQAGWFTRMEQGAAGYLDKLNAIIATQGMMAGAAAVTLMGRGQLGQFEVMAEAAQRAQEEMRKLTPEIERVGDAFADLFVRMSGYAGASKDVTSGLSALIAKMMTIPSEVAKQQAETEKATDAMKKHTDELIRQAATMGMGAEAAARYAAAQAQNANVSDAVKNADILAGRAVDARREAIKATAEYIRQDKSDQEYIARLQDEIAAIGQTSQYKQYLIDLSRAEKAANEDNAKTLRDLAAARYADAQAKAEADLLSKTNIADTKSLDEQIKKNQAIVDAYHKVVDAVDLVAQANAKYEKGMEALDEMLKLHPEMLEQIRVAEAKLKQQRDDTISGMDKYREAEHQLREQMGSDLSNVLSDMLVNGFQDGGKKLLDMQKNIAKELIDFWIKQKIIIPMEQQMKTAGGGVGGGGMDMTTGLGMAGMVVGSAIGGQAGSILSGAAGGAMMGSMIMPGIGTAIGAVVGGLLGAFGGGGDKTPAFSIYGGGGYGQAQEQFTTSLGTFGERSWHSNFDGVSQVKDTISKFDTELAKMLDTTQLDATRAALARSGEIHYEGSNPQNVLKQHLDAAIDATMPKFKQFIDGMYSLQDRLNAFQGLLALQKDLDTLQDAIVQLSGSPAEKAANQLMQLDRAVTDAQDKLASAIKMRDPAEIVSAEQALKQAVTSRYQQEMQMLAQVQQAIAQLEANSYSLNFSIQQKIAAISGDFSGVIDTAKGRMTELRSQIEGSTDPAEQIGLLNQFTGALDNWLSSATQAVNDALNNTIALLEAQKQGVTDNLNAQIQDIENQKTAEQQRMQDANTAAQAARQAEQQARQAQIQDLQKQLQLANQWQQVLDKTSQTINSLMTGSANPLGPYSQLANLETIIADRVAAVKGESGDQQAKDAAQLVSDLQQRLQLIQSGNLYQRSSPEYMEQYNRTLAQLAEVQALAGPRASQADLLQAQLTALQNMGANISAGNAKNSELLTQLNQREADLKAEAQKQLDALNKKEEEARAQAKEQIDKLNKEALDYYTWAKTTAQAAEQKRHDELVAQLKAITGGLDPQSFIAQETAREVDLLNSINNNMKDFLKSISSQTGGTGAGSGAGAGSGGGAGGGGGGAKNPIAPSAVGAPMSVTISTVVNGTGMGAADIAAAVSDGLADALPAAVPALKRMMKVA